jgi:hypothetical protein
VGLEVNGAHQLLAYADDVNLLGDNVNAIKKNTETLIDVSWSAAHSEVPGLILGATRFSE